ncbi:MAG TPA: asparagine synthase (glutamine-hydrolyzing) [Bacteroidia bacterium]|nr:asparagine synthase (glutamine-hydrolyzing) [Bacteroidia bacterium]
MCGIGGIINLENKNINLGDGAHILSKKLRHRGPDDEGFLFFSNEKTACAFGDDTQKESIGNTFNFSGKIPLTDAGQEFTGVFMHRRLAIIDTGASGHQPMCSADEKLWVTYNGEIYNYIELRSELEKSGYKFRTHSDTEVLLNAYQHWGIDCLQKLNGMFAFALWDKENKKLFCARDRSGVKPFYYYFKNGLFCFASELKALKALPFVETGLNERAVNHYLLHDALEYEPEGFLKNVFELFPSHYLQFDLQNPEIKQVKYFEIICNKGFVPFNENSFAESCAQTKQLINNAIIKRLRSDVAVGCCLSGGIDSSVISGVIAGHNKNFNAFTATFPGEEIDESKYAREVAEFTKATWHTVTPGENELLDDYEKMVYALDIPIWSTSTYAQFRVMQLAKEKNIKVVLDGQGGDELFAGYPHYYTTFINELLGKKQFKRAASEIKSFGNNFWLLYTKENAKRKLHYNANKKYLNKEFVSAHDAPAEMSTKFNSLNEHLQYDFFGGRLKTYLRCEDRCSMHHSVESRTPFADDTLLIENAFKTSSSFKIKNGNTKFILRESMKEFLPDAIYNRNDKMGFVTPHNKWLGILLGKYPEINNEGLLKNYFTNQFLERLNHLPNKTNHLPKGVYGKEENLSFKALTLSVWYKSFYC